MSHPALAAALCIFTVTLIPAQQFHVTDWQRAFHWEEIEEELQTNERVPVLVWLEQDVRPEHVLIGLPSFELKYIYDACSGLAGTGSRVDLECLRADPRVSYMVLDKVVRGALVQTRSLLQADIVESNLALTGSGITVAVVDSGIDYTHPNLTGYLGGYDFVNSDSDPMDDEGHGTKVAGIIASTHPAVRGMAPGANLVAAKVLGSNNYGTVSDIAAGINWCVINQQNFSIRVINISIGATAYTPSFFPSYYDPALLAAYNAGMIVVASSGNKGSTIGISYPAVSPLTISVGATYDSNFGQNTFTSGSFSCTDPTTQPDQMTCFSNRASFLDLVAPGASIVSTKLGGSFQPGQGTSFSAPHVAGVAALMLELHPGLTPDQIRAIVTSSPVQVFDPLSGLTFPRVDALHAVQSVSIAAALPVGSGCGGGPLPPTLNATPPLLGATLALTLSDCTPVASGAIVISAIPASHTQLGLACAIYIDLGTLDVLTPIGTDASGAASWSLPLPLAPVLSGLQVALQGYLLPTAGPLGLDLTNGMNLTLGF